MIEAQELEVEVWIPEPIGGVGRIPRSDLENARTSHEGVRARAAAAGADDLIEKAWDEPTDVHRVVAEIEDALGNLDRTDVLYLRSSPHLAVAGLRDQVLLQGAARPKSNVKTGAADSTSLSGSPKQN